MKPVALAPSARYPARASARADGDVTFVWNDADGGRGGSGVTPGASGAPYTGPAAGNGGDGGITAGGNGGSGGDSAGCNGGAGGTGGSAIVTNSTSNGEGYGGTGGDGGDSGGGFTGGTGGDGGDGGDVTPDLFSPNPGAGGLGGSPRGASGQPGT